MRPSAQRKHVFRYETESHQVTPTVPTFRVLLPPPPRAASPVFNNVPATLNQITHFHYFEPMICGECGGAPEARGPQAAAQPFKPRRQTEGTVLISASLFPATSILTQTSFHASPRLLVCSEKCVVLFILYVFLGADCKNLNLDRVKRNSLGTEAPAWLVF